MKLRSFSYGGFNGVNDLPVEVLNLFIPLVNDPDKRVEYASEIVDAGLNGRIDFSKEFNIDAYEAAIRKNQFLSKEGKRKKESYIDFSDSDFDEVVSTGGVKIDRIQLDYTEEIKDAFEEVLLNEELAYAVSTIKSLNEEFISDVGVDLIFTMKRAVKGIPQAVQELKKICSEFSIVAELIETILSSKQELGALFA